MDTILLDKDGRIDPPALVLVHRNLKNKYGNIANATDIVYKKNFNSWNEISFTVYKALDGREEPRWDDLVDGRVLYVPEIGEYFEIKTALSESEAVQKNVTGTSLGEAELSGVMLYDIEINTEDDIARDDYDEDFPTVFYREPEAWDSGKYDWTKDKYSYINSYPLEKQIEEKKRIIRGGSLLHRLMEKAANYKIGHVDKSLRDLEYVWKYSISDTDLYSELTGEISEDFQCLFTIDSATRTLSAYDLCNTCSGCGYRGDFDTECPECGSRDFGGAYGEDTGVFVSRDNLSLGASMDTDWDSVKNCFYVEGGDDSINAAVRAVNPNGSQYIYQITDDVKSDMPDELVAKLEEYDKDYKYYDEEHVFAISEDAVSAYNSVVESVNGIFSGTDGYEDYLELPDEIVGYSETTDYVYQAIDLGMFLQTSMMPTLSTEGHSLEESAEAIVEGFKSGFSKEDGTAVFENEIAIGDLHYTLELSVTKRIENTAKLFFNTGYYTVDAECGSYSSWSEGAGYRIWKGTMTLTSTDEVDSDGQLKSIAVDIPDIKVTEDWELFVQMSIAIATQDYDELSDYDFTSINYKGDFAAQLEKYSYDELENLEKEYSVLMNVVIDAGIDEDDEMKSRYYDFYYDRTQDIIAEKAERAVQLEAVYAVYKVSTGDSGNTSVGGELYEKRAEVSAILDFQSYLGDSGLWEAFCSYRREDKYSNDNYISDGLSNSELVARTRELVKEAAKELRKASKAEISITETLGNLMLIPEFGPLLENFDVGNWIRVSVDGEIYRLRLLSYQMDFSSVQEISVEFSTTRDPWSGVSDVQSVIDSASSIAKSYDGIMGDVKDVASVTKKYVKNWVDEGLKATQMKYVDSDNQELLIDESGLLARRLDPVTEEYDLYQLKIIHNGLYTTSDAWKSIDVGIGRIAYIDPDSDEEVNDYGIIAKTVVGKLILGEKLKIYGENGSVKLDGDGIEIKGGYLYLESSDGKDYVEIDPMKRNDGYVFKIRMDGDDIMTVTSTGAEIAGWEILPTKLRNVDKNDSDKYMELDAANRAIYCKNGTNKAVMTSGYLGLFKNETLYSKFITTSWTTQENVYGTAVRSEVDSKFVSFGNKDTSDQTDYLTNFLINYGLNPALDNGYVCDEDVIVFGSQRITGGLYFGGTESCITALTGGGLYCGGDFCIDGKLQGGLTFSNGFSLGTFSVDGVQTGIHCSGMFKSQGAMMVGGDTYYSGYMLNVSGNGYFDGTLSTTGAVFVGNVNYNQLLNVSGNGYFRGEVFVDNGSHEGSLASSGGWFGLFDHTFYTDSNPGYAFYVDENGDVHTRASVSDERMKKDIKETAVTDALDQILTIEHKEFIVKNSGKHKDLGYIAQELEKINPLLVDIQAGLYTVDTFYMESLITKAIQEFHADYESRITKLEEELKELKRIAGERPAVLNLEGEDDEDESC